MFRIQTVNLHPVRERETSPCVYNTGTSRQDLDYGKVEIEVEGRGGRRSKETIC